MTQNNIESFLEDVISHIRFPFARAPIWDELEGHILDKIDFYEDQGYSKEEAQKSSLKDMGDPKTIGRELNKEHNPFIGWFLKISNGFIILSGIFVFFTLGISILVSPFIKSPTEKIPKENIVYKIQINERVKIDNRIIRFTDLIYENNANMNIIYNSYETGFSGNGWSLSSIGEISDNLGNSYNMDSVKSTGGFPSRSLLTINNFSKDADLLIIEYDQYNRNYRVEVNLKEGEEVE